MPPLLSGGHVVHGAAHVLGRLFQVEAHQQLAGLVGLGVAHRLPVVEVGHQGHETLPGQAVGHVLDVVDQAPPLLDHHQARVRSRPPAWPGSRERSNRCSETRRSPPWLRRYPRRAAWVQARAARKSSGAAGQVAAARPASRSCRPPGPMTSVSKEAGTSSTGRSHGSAGAGVEPPQQRVPQGPRQDPALAGHGPHRQSPVGRHRGRAVRPDRRQDPARARGGGLHHHQIGHHDGRGHPGVGDHRGGGTGVVQPPGEDRPLPHGVGDQHLEVAPAAQGVARDVGPADDGDGDVVG